MIANIQVKDLETISVFEEVTFGPDREDSSMHISIPMILGSCQDKEAVISVVSDLITFSKRYLGSAYWFLDETLQKRLEAADEIIISDNPGYGGVVLSREIDNYQMQVRLIKQFGMYTVDVKWHHDRFGDEFSLEKYFAYLKLRPKFSDFRWSTLELNNQKLTIPADLSERKKLAEELKNQLFLTDLSFNPFFEIPNYFVSKLQSIALEQGWVRRVDSYFSERENKIVAEIVLLDYTTKQLGLLFQNQGEEKAEQVLVGYEEKGENFSLDLYSLLQNFVQALKEHIELIKSHRDRWEKEKPIYKK